MKATSLFISLAVAGASWIAMLTTAGLPQPMCVYYGQALDGYGLPYRTNADVILYHGTNEIARHTIAGSLKPGINFALYAHLDDGRSGSATYSPRALHTGDVVWIAVRDLEGFKTIMENLAVPPVGQPGELVLVYVTAAKDENRDGLPDQWEWDLIDWSDGRLRSLTDVRPEDDLDGDGMTNLQEYQAGTFAFLDYDYLRIESVEATPNQHARLTFLSVAGKAYSVSSTSDMLQATWRPCLVGLTDTEAPQQAVVEGTGDWLSVYVPLGDPVQFFRLAVH